MVNLIDSERQMEFHLVFSEKFGLDVDLSPAYVLRVNHDLSAREALDKNGIMKVNPFITPEMMVHENFGQVSIAAHLLSFNMKMGSCSDVLVAMHALGLVPLGWYDLVHFNKYRSILENKPSIFALRTVWAMSGWDCDIFQVPCLCGEGSLEIASYECEKSSKCKYLVTTNNSFFFINHFGH